MIIITQADAHLDAAAVTPFRTLPCPVTEASTVISTMPYDTEVIPTGPGKKKKDLTCRAVSHRCWWEKQYVRHTVGFE